MILRSHVLAGIRDGSITLAFRRWRRPTVRGGGTLMTAAGQLRIVSVAPIERADIAAAEAAKAGYPSLDALLRELDAVPEGTLYRITFGELQPDPRVSLRARVAVGAELDAVMAKLDRLDHAAGAPWTARVLALIDGNPGVRAADLCGRVGQPIEVFKPNVRKLKALGLTESLEVGYRLSPRGRAVLAANHLISARHQRAARLP